MIRVKIPLSDAITLDFMISILTQPLLNQMMRVEIPSTEAMQIDDKNRRIRDFVWGGGPNPSSIPDERMDKKAKA